jgi:hypothetical protein
MADSIRDRIKSIQKRVLSGAFTPALARDNLMQLTALLGNVIEEHREADHEYAVLLSSIALREKSVSRARIVANTTAQYDRAREAKDTEKLVIEMIRACKVYLKSLDEEMRLAG